MARMREPVEGLLPCAGFQRELDKERARVDRFGGELSLLVFTPSDEVEQARTLNETSRVLKMRIRATDEIGWMDAVSLGALLPGTDAEGARRFSEIVLGRLGPDVPPPVVRVYSYVESGDGSEGRKLEGDDETPPPDVRTFHEMFVEPVPVMKRALDIAISGTALLLLAPLFLIVCAVIKFTSPGPAIFSQKRMGRGRRPFMLHKFRSMSADADLRKCELMALNEVDGPVFKMTRDPRVTSVGRLLRATCLDELPQLWNVFVGEMSLVGPRPLPWDEACQCVRWQTRRFDVVPGLTCLWQVQSSRNSIPFTEWMRLDLDYIRRSSLQEDLRLIWKTGKVMFGGRGI